MGIFSMFSNSSKEAEIGQLINNTMAAAHAWEVKGKLPGGQEIMEAATAIRKNGTRIINVYCDLVNIRGSRNLYFRTGTVSTMPSEMEIPSAIRAIIDYASAIASKNPSFSHGLIDQTAIIKFNKIISGN